MTSSTPKPKPKRKPAPEPKPKRKPAPKRKRKSTVEERQVQPVQSPPAAPPPSALEGGTPGALVPTPPVGRSPATAIVAVLAHLLPAIELLAAQSGRVVRTTLGTTMVCVGVFGVLLLVRTWRQ